jgi:hypothetical protein
MNKIATLSIISIGLLLTNLLMAGFIFFKKPHKPPFREPKNIIIEKLSLDEAQQDQYDLLIREHRKEIRENDDKIRECKELLYHTLVSEKELSINDSLINEIGRLQVNIEKAHYLHFKKIKNICNPEQQEAFNEFSRELAHLFAPPPPHRR